MKIAHAGHAELLVHNLEASKQFFTEAMGLSITEEDATSVYLRAWQDWEHHTLILRKGEKSALVHLGWRVETPESLEQYAHLFDESGIVYRWVEAGTERGQGRALRFSSLRYGLGACSFSHPTENPSVGTGKVVTLPCTSILRKRDDLLQDLRIYMDVSPVFA